MGLVEKKLQEIGFDGDADVLKLLSGLSGLEEELISPVPTEPDRFFGNLILEAWRWRLINQAEYQQLIDALRPYLAKKERARLEATSPAPSS